METRRYIVVTITMEKKDFLIITPFNAGPEQEKSLASVIQQRKNDPRLLDTILTSFKKNIGNIPIFVQSEFELKVEFIDESELEAFVNSLSKSQKLLSTICKN